MKITILGCGPAVGLPAIGADDPVSLSHNPKNKRRRSSIFVDIDGVHILIDTATELRMQALDNNITHIDAVLYTHDHSDHTHGIDDLRRFSVMQQERLHVYSDKKTLDSLKTRFPHAFAEPMPEWGYYKLSLIDYEISPGHSFDVKGVSILPFNQIHGPKNTSLGYRIGNMAYSTDVSDFEEKSFALLEQLDLWIVDCQNAHSQNAITHSYLDKTLGWIERTQPKRAILTHLSHELEYESLKAKLPLHIEPAYDNMVIEIDH